MSRSPSRKKRANGHVHVPRRALIDEISAELECNGVILLAGTAGLGKTTLLADIARESREACPERPVIRIDLGSPEARAYREGRRRPFEEWLANEVENVRAAGGEAGARDDGEGRPANGEVDDASGAQEGDSDTTGSGADKGRAPSGRQRFPHGCTGPTPRIVWSCMRAHAPEWARANVGSRAAAMPASCLAPLVLIDNFTREAGDELEVASLAELMGNWRRAGARFVIASGPLDCPGAQIPDALRIGGRLLRVGEAELPAWCAGLCLPSNIDLGSQTRGIPVLIDAARSTSGVRCLLEDPRFSAAVERLLAQNLAEPLSPEANRARAAMVLLGKGSMADLAAAGVHVKSDDLVFLADEFPLLGLDACSGSFSCLGTDAVSNGSEMLRVARMYGQLTSRCIDVLVERGDQVRAAGVVCLLGDVEVARALGRHPAAFVDAGCDGIIAQCLRAPCPPAGFDARTVAGLASLRELYDRVHGRMLPAEAPAPAARGMGVSGPCAEAIAAIDAVMGAWRMGGTDASGVARGAGDAHGARGARAHGICASGVRSLPEICAAMVDDALAGHVQAFVGSWDELADHIDADAGGIAASVLATFSVLCACMCGQASRALAWVTPLAARERRRRGNPRAQQPATFSDALLSAVVALAGILCEKPSATRACSEAIEEIGRSRAFFESRSLRPATACAAFLEGACLILAGHEEKAAPLLEGALSVWAACGDAVGQAACSAAVAVVQLVRGAPAQARVYAATVTETASRSGMGPLGAFAHMLDSIASLLGDGPGSVDGIMLGDELRRSSLSPRTSVFLEAEMAALLVGTGDVSSAVDILQAPGLFDTAYRRRVLVLCARCMGRHKRTFVDLLPRELCLDVAAVEGPDPVAEPAAGAGQALLYGARSRRPVRIEVFGGLRVHKNGHAIGDREWGRRISRELVMLFALYPQRPFTRAELLQLLWGDRQGTANRNNLSSALSTLRRTLGQGQGGPEYVLAVGDSVMLNPDTVETDVGEFERLARSVLSHGVTLPAGEFMESCRLLEELYGQGVPVCEGTLERLARRRSRELAEAFVDCMLAGAQRALEGGAPTASLFFSRAARRVAPGRDDVEACLLEALRAVRESGLDAIGERGLPLAAESFLEPVGRVPATAGV